MIGRAKEVGVSLILMPAIDSDTHESMLQTEAAEPATCLSMMGLHPCSVKESYRAELKLAEEWLAKRPFIAIGETGLDYYWDLQFKEQQVDAFNRQLEWALHFDIPVVIHSRNAADECIEMVASHQKGKLKGVFHCFSGSAEQAKEIERLGFFLGIGGVLTYKNSGLDRALADIPLTSLLLETDAPYLSPVPFRGKRNECSYLIHSAKKLAELKGVSIDEVAAITTSNAQKLFAL
jgi:TatD DNase family protein